MDNQKRDEERDQGDEQPERQQQGGRTDQGLPGGTQNRDIDEGGRQGNWEQGDRDQMNRGQTQRDRDMEEGGGRE